ncbi:MAG: DUF1236 domain-containing protein [Alphaproteobacteria bacterium]
MLRLCAVLLAGVLIGAGAVAQPQKNGCPPGLAKKNNGCLPPGQAKKRYEVGKPVPREVVWREVPKKVIIVLEPPGDGRRWVEIDNDLVLIAEATRQVIKAIDAVERAAKGI